MARQWTEEETRALREYIDSHRGHCDGLTGPYWDELSLALENVRKTGDPVLKRPQVANKIVQFRKREVPCSHILQYGTTEGRIKKSKIRKKPPKSKADLTEPASTAGTPLDSSEVVIKQPSTVQNDVQNSISIEKASTASSALPASCEQEYDLKCKPKLHTPIRLDTIDNRNPCASSDAHSGSCAGLKRTKSEDSCSTSTPSGSKRRRIRRSIAHERSTQAEFVSKKQPIKTSTPERTNDAGKLARPVSAQMQGNTAKELESSKGLSESDTLSFIDLGTSPWQDQMLYAWQCHLAHQNLIHITQQEPIDHREVLYMIEDILNRICEASEAMQRILSNVSNLSALGPSSVQILSVLTGHKTQTEAADIVKIGQSLAPLSTGANFLRAFIGATVHQWVFEEFRLVGPGKHCHDLNQTVFDSFIERECPKLWTSYQNLYHHQFLSTYNEERIVGEAKKMASDVYFLLSAACSATTGIQAPPPTDRLTFSTAFPIQAQHYQTFKNNMVEAYRLALDLRVSLARCSDLTYEFHFPKMRDAFDASCMEARKSGGDDGVIGSENQCIAACFLPSIWSRARADNDYGKSSMLVTKAIVLL